MNSIFSMVFNLAALIAAIFSIGCTLTEFLTAWTPGEFFFPLWGWALCGVAYTLKDVGHYFYEKS